MALTVERLRVELIIRNPLSDANEQEQMAFVRNEKRNAKSKTQTTIVYHHVVICYSMYVLVYVLHICIVLLYVMYVYSICIVYIVCMYMYILYSIVLYVYGICTIQCIRI